MQLLVFAGILGVAFGASRPVADISEDMHAYLLTRQRRSWPTIWSQERTLTVS